MFACEYGAGGVWVDWDSPGHAGGHDRVAAGETEWSGGEVVRSDIAGAAGVHHYGDVGPEFGYGVVAAGYAGGCDLCGPAISGFELYRSAVDGHYLGCLGDGGTGGVISILAREMRGGELAGSREEAEFQSDGEPYSVSQIVYAWLPYVLLVACVLLWGYKPVQTWLNLATVAFRWPLLHDMVRRMPPIVARPSPYHAIFNLNWFSAAGTSCMVATLLSAVCLRLSLRRFVHLLFGVTRQLLLPTATVALVLAIAFLMNYCGATATLGLGFAAAGVAFPFCSALLGWLGVFLTGSDTSANALFGNLQVVTAGRLGLDPVLMAAANSAGGVMGKMISLQTIAVAAAATGITVADQAMLFRFTLKHSIIVGEPGWVAGAALFVCVAALGAGRLA